MFTKKLLIVVAPVLLSFSAISHAADGLYFGLSGGIMDNDDSGFDDGVSGGLALGYEFRSVGIGDVAIEGIFTQSVTDADAPNRQDWEIETVGLYGVFRSAGPVYFKAKGGLQSIDIEIDRESDDELEFSVGAGVGFSTGIFQFELDYTRIEDQINFIALQVNLKTPL